PDEASATRIAQALVGERLAACVNRIPGIASTYRWEGEIHDEGEVLLLIKSVRERFDALRDRILALHPYELPEIIAVDIASGHAPYLDWIAAATELDASPR
ncbi:MAG: divalent-cation tolerance protein CutA, partial [Proteobacteria bacterium]|nr:divalent-cation tolerance protein CutA [Pseudomonadota bacterium]